MSNWDDMVLVGTIARPHGLQGQVVLNPETDFVDERFKPGAALWTQRNGEPRELVVTSMRVHSGRPIVAFAGYDSIEAVEPLAGLELRLPEEALQPLADGAYYHHQLVGCRVEVAGGGNVGTVRRVEAGAGGALLVVEGARGDVLIPLAADICTGIDVREGRIRIEAPEGLLDLNDPAHTKS